MSGFINIWINIFMLRMITVLITEANMLKMTVREIEFLNNKDSTKVKNLYYLNNYFEFSKWIFSPNHFDKWLPSQFIKFAIHKRIDEKKDFIYENYYEEFINRKE